MNEFDFDFGKKKINNMNLENSLTGKNVIEDFSYFI